MAKPLYTHTVAVVFIINIVNIIRPIYKCCSSMFYVIVDLFWPTFKLYYMRIIDYVMDSPKHG